ncbi:MAG: nicotinamide-nucleotide amidohydrolase family protein [Peptococcaceae bacterium]|nr:nicotinamide-nucleotide amidohydrolase family protein [Peptococcaceae bacterium]
MSDYSYPVLDEGMGQALETLASVLLQKGETLAVAESCTGGLLAGYITGLAGSSQFFKGGVVSYTDEVKERVLEVPARVLEQFGAVSSPVARAMAEGAARVCGSDFGISITGLSGPDTDGSQNPIGLVYLGASYHGKSTVKSYIFKGDRQQIRGAAVKSAMEMALKILK